MQHLIVVAHPLEDSITMKMARTFARELQQLGHNQKNHDLYRMRFNPVMGAHELEPRSVGHSADADVAQAQEDVRAAAVLTMVYPLWWATMPAMMKGYIDGCLRGDSPTKPALGSFADSWTESAAY
jgi:NAD(P)H dehydrogenase (quinone)